MNLMICRKTEFKKNKNSSNFLVYLSQSYYLRACVRVRVCVCVCVCVYLLLLLLLLYIYVMQDRCVLVQVKVLVF